MQASVVICTHAEERYGDFVEAVESILEQTYTPVEIVLVSDGNERVYSRAEDDFGGRKDVVIHCNEKNRGVSYSRTKGAELASGDVVAFIDDDAVAEPDWLAELISVYESRDAVAVGGRMAGEWVAGKPWYLPEEFYWLVGVTHRGFANDGEEVRNTFESNISFRREAFVELGGFDTGLGPTADNYGHSEGAEIGARLQASYDCGVVYTSTAVVRHKVFEQRTQLGWLVRRAFKQGVSKRQMEQRSSASSNEEVGFLQTLATTFFPERVRDLLKSPSRDRFVQLLMIFVLTVCVVSGYGYATVTELY